MSVMTNHMLEQQLLHLHTSFIGRITKLSKDCDTACVQPLDLLKPLGQQAKRQAVLSDIPVLEHCRYRLVEEKRQCLINGNNGCSCNVTTSVSTTVNVNTETGSGTGTGTGTGSGTVNCSCREETRVHLKKEPIISLEEDSKQLEAFAVRGIIPRPETAKRLYQIWDTIISRTLLW